MSARRWVLALLPLLVGIALIGAVRETARAERLRVSDETTAVRVVTYVVEKGQSLRIPLEPNTDVLRIVAHAFRLGTLTQGRHTAALSATVRGARREYTEMLTFALAGTSTRAAVEVGDVAVGDPLALNVDVRDAGVGDITLVLDSIEDADGILIRAYRRESMGMFEAFRRRTGLGAVRREHLARRAGEPDWLDLEAAAHATLVTARWKKVAAVVDAERGVPSRSLALKPRLAVSREEGVLMEDVDLRGDERVTGVLRGPGTLVARGNEGMRLTFSVSDRSGETRTLTDTGTLRLPIEARKVFDFELSTSGSQHIALYAANPDRLSLASAVAYFRTTPDRPAIIAAGSEPLVLHVTARRPMERSSAEDSAVSLRASIETPLHALRTTTFAATVSRSRYDRYEPPCDEYAPSTATSFYVLVPAGGRATLRPQEGFVDLSLAELDPRAPPRSVESVPDADDTVARWSGLAFRRPTNADDFPRDAHGLVRVGRRAPASMAPVSKLPVYRVLRPPSAEAIHRDGKVFEPAQVRLVVHVSGKGPVVLPARFYAKERIDVVAMIDGGHPRRRQAGIARWVTTSRSASVEGEVKIPIVLGDDLEPGMHELTFASAPNELVWVHLPWVHRGVNTHESAWIAGDLGL